jgi:hypothetical protein
MNAVGAMKQLVNSTTSKSRQPNHIISCGGIISTKLASATVQDASLNSKQYLITFAEMDMNALMKKLAGKPGNPNQNAYNTNYV